MEELEKYRLYRLLNYSATIVNEWICALVRETYRHSLHRIDDASAILLHIMQYPNVYSNTSLKIIMKPEKKDSKDPYTTKKKGENRYH